jgi:RNA polymerase sigma-54 factor
MANSMNLVLRPSQILTHKLVMNLQMQQAIKLLQLSRMELVETIQQELAENPALEEAPESQAEDRIDDLSGLHEYLNPYDYSRGSRETEAKEFNSFETYTASKESLTDHLLRQLLMTSPTGEEEKIGSLIAGSLDRDGYLRVSVDEIAGMSKCEPEKAEQVLFLMQTFDPPGVCARDLKECLLLQTAQLGPKESLADEIVTHHLKDLEKKDYRSIAKALKVSLDNVISGVNIIQSLEPRPGRQFSDESPQYIVPDIYVFKIKNEFVISLNNSGLPTLRISSFFKKALKSGKEISEEENDFLREKLSSAKWLIKSIDERRKTLYRVMQSILNFQHGFFENGTSHLKPMVLRDVADDIEMSESTISRVTTNKYAHTPHGIFELKYFFTSSVKSSQGEPISATVVQEKIKQIISAEDPYRPLSDDRIAKVLKTLNIDIARRTVTKYRENLRIPTSSKRKQFKY